MVAHHTFNVSVPGSNPGWLTRAVAGSSPAKRTKTELKINPELKQSFKVVSSEFLMKYYVSLSRSPDEVIVKVIMNNRLVEG